MHAIAGWWDGFELWVAGLPFIPQFLVVLVGMVPISFAIAYGLDRVLRAAMHALGRDRAVAAAALQEPPLPVAEMREPVQSGAR
ncbi:hypothetical protein [Nocardia sp. NPDC057440]|uniref:hypothetical protein n=1 Tax=Nocardia sp. NPDC057440 TaxID=3346134 RepID=UPI00366F4102